MKRERIIRLARVFVISLVVFYFTSMTLQKIGFLEKDPDVWLVSFIRAFFFVIIYIFFMENKKKKDDKKKEKE